MSAKCPVRRRLIKEKSKEIRERSRSRSRSRNRDQTYAQAAGKQTKGKEQTEEQRDEYVKVVSSITYAFMVEDILPGTFHDTIKEMYHLNNLPNVKFPAYIPSNKIQRENVQEEIRKMRSSYKTAKKDPEQARTGEQTQTETEVEMEADDVRETETEIEEKETRKRVLTSPEEKEQRQVKPKRTEIDEVEGTEGAAAPVSRQISDLSRTSETIIEGRHKEPREEHEIIIKSPKEPKNKELFDKHLRNMKFCFVKTADTLIKKGDFSEITQLIKAGKLKYVYGNSIYHESDCRALWERGYVNLSITEIRNISREGFQRIRYNGTLITERRSSTSGSGTIPKRK